MGQCLSGWIIVLIFSAATAVAQEDPAPGTETRPDAEATAAPRQTGNIGWNPKTTPEEIKAFFNKELQQFDPATKLSTLNADAEKVLAEHLQNAVNSLTVESEIDNFKNIRDRKILDKIENPQTSDAARGFMLDAVLKHASQLLFNDTQPPIVQLNLVVLMAQLNSKPADLAANPQKPAVPYVSASKPLLQALTTKTLPPICRINAASGLQRILRDAEVQSVDRADLGKALAGVLEEKLDSPLAQRWLHLRVIQALGVTNRVYDVANNPTIIDALMKALANAEGDWIIRTAAARAITQLPFDQSVNVELINHEIGKLALQLSGDYNESRSRTASDWRCAFTMVYLSYTPAQKVEQQKKWGLLFKDTQRGREQAKALYGVLLPILKPMIESADGREIPAAQIKALGDWLAKNKPADRKVTPASKELPEAAPSADKGPPMTNTGGAAESRRTVAVPREQ